MVPDSEIRPYLVLCPAPILLDLLVALLHPHPQPVQSGYLGDVDRRSRYDLAIFGPPATYGARCGPDTHS